MYVISLIEISSLIKLVKINLKSESEDAIIRIDAGFAEKLAEKIIKQSKQFEIDVPKLFVPLELRHLIFTLLSNYINNIVVLAREEIGCNAQVDIIAEI